MGQFNIAIWLYDENTLFWYQACELLHALYYYYYYFEIILLLLLLLLHTLSYIAITITITLTSITIPIILDKIEAQAEFWCVDLL